MAHKHAPDRRASVRSLTEFSTLTREWCQVHRDDYVCLYMSFRLYNSKTTRPNFHHILCMLPMTLSPRRCSTVHYVLPVLWMTSRFSHDGPMARHVYC